MSGLTYCAIDMGPVPDSYRTLNDMLVREGYLETYIYPLSNGELVDAFRPAVHLEESYFSSRELDVLNQIVEHFKTKSTQEVITISHQEPAWKDNNGQKARIDYQKYAFQLIAFTH